MIVKFCVESAAKYLMGDISPHSIKGSDVRYGNKGSLSINTDSNTFYCHESGEGGGVIDLIKYKLGLNSKEAFNWYQANIEQSSIPIKKQVEAKTKSTGYIKYAQSLWVEGKACDRLIAEHPYAIKKGVYWAAGARRGKASGKLIGVNSDCLIIPMRDLDRNLVGVECINHDGKKQTFGSKGVLFLGNDLDVTLTQHIVEGWATAGRLFHLLKGNAALYICFGKSKSQFWAERVEEKNPDRVIVIVEEDDDKDNHATQD